MPKQLSKAKAEQVGRVKARLTFTEEERKTIADAADAVWSEVGYDVLQGIADWGGPRKRNVDSVTISRAEVIEIVLDAGRLEEMLKDRSHRASPDLLDRFRKADYDTLIAIVTTAFPHGRYGT